MDTAARLERVSPETLTDARKRDLEVADQIEEARARGQAALIALLHRDADAGRHIARSTWLLERLYPKQFHLPSALAVTEPVDGAGPDPVAASCPYSPEDFRRLAQAAVLMERPEVREALRPFLIDDDFAE